jgi:high-affinity Fe2+/Pb2+ permease
MEMREKRQLKNLRLGKKSLKIAGLLAVIGIVFGIIIGPMLSFLPDVSGNGENFLEYNGGACLMIAMLIVYFYLTQWFKARGEEKKDYEIHVEGKLALPKDYNEYCNGTIML